ncbi:MAG: hemerythrin domain-containing protein [Nitrososphaerota archaeon]|nr:hemerythrin domain-containing protein [Nitrososphaerota archaeon]MDG6931366.1 hemerythrin domain-containing protein [Nitrososphaerota archaeon]
MDPVDLLLYEHSALRVLKSEWEGGYQRVDFKTLNDFVVNHHARVEDIYVFPMIKASNPDDLDLAKSVDRISADHKLIETLGSNIVKWINSNDIDMLKRRIPVYWKILSEHNMTEEKAVFYRLKGTLDSVNGIVESIKSFGIDEYIKITGISSSMLEMYFSP